MFIVYENTDEVLVTTTSRELSFLSEWFKDAGRKLEDYDRTESDESAILVTTRMYAKT